MIRVTKKDTSGVIPVASELQVYDLSTDENKSLRTAKRPSLYAALDLAATWLSRGLPDEQKQNA